MSRHLMKSIFRQLKTFCKNYPGLFRLFVVIIIIIMYATFVCGMILKLNIINKRGFGMMKQLDTNLLGQIEGQGAYITLVV